MREMKARADANFNGAVYLGAGAASITFCSGLGYRVAGRVLDSLHPIRRRPARNPPVGV